jgi:hypothetical protein
MIQTRTHNRPDGHPIRITWFYVTSVRPVRHLDAGSDKSHLLLYCIAKKKTENYNPTKHEATRAMLNNQKHVNKNDNVKLESLYLMI